MEHFGSLARRGRTGETRNWSGLQSSNRIPDNKRDRSEVVVFELSVLLVINGRIQSPKLLSALQNECGKWRIANWSLLANPVEIDFDVPRDFSFSFVTISKAMTKNRFSHH